MTEKLFYWAENIEDYHSDHEKDDDQIIEIKRLNFFIGKNNAGKSRFLRSLFLNNYPSNFYNNLTFRKNIKSFKGNIFRIENFSYSSTKSDHQLLKF